MNKSLVINHNRILVVGDIMLDVYYRGDVSRISPEAPTPIFLKECEEYSLGGAGNVSVNLVSANQSVSVMGIVGNDDSGKIVLKLLSEHGIDLKNVVTENRLTTTKTRLLASNNQQVIRIDTENTGSISDDLSNRLLEILSSQISRYDLILISDYAKGFVTDKMSEGIIRLANENEIPVFVDVKGKNSSKYKNATLLKPNRNELSILAGIPVNSMEDVRKATGILKEKTSCKYILATCGEEGMYLVGDGIAGTIIKSIKREVFDVTGAGDTTIAFLSACYASGYGIDEACEIANRAASIQVSKVGAKTVELHEIIEDYWGSKSNSRNKLFDYKDIDFIRQIVDGKKVKMPFSLSTSAIVKGTLSPSSSTLNIINCPAFALRTT